jgi:hypothetical protein
MIAITMLAGIIEAVFCDRYILKKKTFNEEFGSLPFSLKSLIWILWALSNFVCKVCMFTVFVMLANIILKKFGG